MLYFSPFDVLPSSPLSATVRLAMVSTLIVSTGNIIVAPTATGLTACKVETMKTPGHCGDGGGLCLQITYDGAQRVSKSWIFRFQQALSAMSASRPPARTRRGTSPICRAEPSPRRDNPAPRRQRREWAIPAGRNWSNPRDERWRRRPDNSAHRIFLTLGACARGVRLRSCSGNGPNIG
jgi:hypothetical protein